MRAGASSPKNIAAREGALLLTCQMTATTTAMGTSTRRTQMLLIQYRAMIDLTAKNNFAVGKQKHNTQVAVKEEVKIAVTEAVSIGLVMDEASSCQGRLASLKGTMMNYEVQFQGYR
mmetsp:Transcript_33281/g.89092  ORF Transcript_33281/g.89092 Transcript_33281/m.89092 type:complete len:117 (+) Transcript_33281:616-966(+)